MFVALSGKYERKLYGELFKVANENLGADFVHDKVFLLGYITLNYNASYFECFYNIERKELIYLSIL